MGPWCGPLIWNPHTDCTCVYIYMHTYTYHIPNRERRYLPIQAAHSKTVRQQSQGARESKWELKASEKSPYRGGVMNNETSKAFCQDVKNWRTEVSHVALAMASEGWQTIDHEHAGLPEDPSC